MHDWASCTKIYYIIIHLYIAILAWKVVRNFQLALQLIQEAMYLNEICKYHDSLLSDCQVKGRYNYALIYNAM